LSAHPVFGGAPLKEVAGAISFFKSSKVAIAVRPMVCLFALRLSCVALPGEVS
jgi:hypothetical protein